MGLCDGVKGLGVERGRQVDGRLGVGGERQVVGRQDPGAVVGLLWGDVGLDRALVSGAASCHNAANQIL